MPPSSVSCCALWRCSPSNAALSVADATHIFDGLNSFPTHVAHMHLGTFLMEPTSWPFTSGTSGGTSVDLGPSPTLYSLALQWLKEDRVRRRALEAQGRKRRGARNYKVSVFNTGTPILRRRNSMKSCAGPQRHVSPLLVRHPVTADSPCFRREIGMAMCERSRRAMFSAGPPSGPI